MPQLRRATAADAALITQHRHQMFTDNEVAPEPVLDTMDLNFEPWVRERLADQRYTGLLLEEDGVVLAGAGIFFGDFPPHFRHTEPGRAYLLNFWTAAATRGRGYAKQLMQACLDECRERGSNVIVLHASKFGRPIYEKFGFTQTNEIMLTLNGSRE